MLGGVDDQRRLGWRDYFAKQRAAEEQDQE
jgi:hypothetical protein